jgi:multiple sugar transport system ATP-binding protein
VPPARAGRYVSQIGNAKLQLGIRPEHLTEAKAQMEPGMVPFEAKLDVTEPMGMETLVYFDLGGTQACGRVNPTAGAKDGGTLRMAADLNNMHLVDAANDLVI